jgi:hypothetical protein
MFPLLLHIHFLLATVLRLREGVAQCCVCASWSFRIPGTISWWMQAAVAVPRHAHRRMGKTAVRDGSAFVNCVAAININAQSTSNKLSTVLLQYVLASPVLAGPGLAMHHAGCGGSNNQVRLTVDSACSTHGLIDGADRRRPSTPTLLTLCPSITGVLITHPDSQSYPHSHVPVTHTNHPTI